MKKKLKLLDCTFRDGGYYNNWDFDYNLQKNYIKTMYNSDIDIIEIGFRFIHKNYFLGQYAYSDDIFLKKKITPRKNKKTAIMINADELIKIGKINYFLNHKKNSAVDIVRIASHLKDIYKIGNSINKIKNLGFSPILNIMQISEYSDKEICNALKFIKKKLSLDVVYFADSLGCLKPNDIKYISNLFIENIDLPIGIHAHDNLGLALKNSLTAIENGVTWIDSTIKGMGRGAGNTKTEELLISLKKIGIKKRKNIPSLLLQNFQELKKEYKWGKSKLYALAAQNSIHPTYIQNLCSQKKIDNKEIKNIAKVLTKFDLKKYSFENFNFLIDKAFQENKKGKWNATKFLNNDKVLIIANSNQLLKYKNDIEDYIKISNCRVLSLNYSDIIKRNLIDYFVFSNHESILANINFFKKNSNSKIIAPKKRIEKYCKVDLNKNIFDYGYETKKNIFKIFKKFSIIPNNLAFTYALALCSIGNAKEICLVGFKGYSNNSKKFLEMNYTIGFFKKKLNIPIYSLLPTSYKLEERSLYERSFKKKF